MDENSLLLAIEKMMDKKLEPINTRLDRMQGDITTMQGDMATMQGDMATMKGDMAIMQGDMTDIKQRVTKIEVTQENVTNRNIGLLIDGHVGLAEKLERLEDVPERIEDIQNTVSVLKTVFTEHIRE